ncbi:MULTISPECIES: acyltransferase [Vibrio]|uniref:acyltransferase n=1 Tax=Vibrio TaxID=662 RepID=UPI002075C033|nr:MULTISPECIES: acyltransferase [Vibrio]USD32690.1 acyltransferase [Vibrio sp. SCSIO 43186]USD45730.1 acyltransferase [Vibrio sp. SCSIO 43145]USD69815.1 acyltransferase [Vibrio sp. SCSIO 43139]USD94720.1 transferase [Vibrio coralliilyticus]
MSLKKLSKLYHYVRCVPKTLFFNFYYLPLSQAIKLPILVNHRTKFVSLGGKVSIPESAKLGKIKLGFGRVQIADNKYSRFIWNVDQNGHIKLGHHIKIGTGSKLHITGTLTIGSGSNFTGEATIVCHREISFGHNCLVSWQTLFMDSDLHKITDSENQQTNPDQPITIEDKVWVGARSTILKGAHIATNSVIASTSTVSRQFDGNTVIGGNPAHAIADFTGKTFHL